MSENRDPEAPDEAFAQYARDRVAEFRRAAAPVTMHAIEAGRAPWAQIMAAQGLTTENLVSTDDLNLDDLDYIPPTAEGLLELGARIAAQLRPRRERSPTCGARSREIREALSLLADFEGRPEREELLETIGADAAFVRRVESGLRVYHARALRGVQAEMSDDDVRAMFARGGWNVSW